MAKDGRIKTTYCFAEAVELPFVQVKDKNTQKVFYICYPSHYLLGRAIARIKRGNTLLVVSHNHKNY